MLRYSSTQTQMKWDGKRVYKTTRYPQILASDSDIQVISNESDSLDSLAYKYYKDPTLYWIIGVANNLGKGRLSVPSGLTLRIPTDTNTIINSFNQLNSQ